VIEDASNDKYSMTMNKIISLSNWDTFEVRIRNITATRWTALWGSATTFSWYKIA